MPTSRSTRAPFAVCLVPSLVSTALLLLAGCATVEQPAPPPARPAAPPPLAQRVAPPVPMAAAAELPGLQPVENRPMDKPTGVYDIKEVSVPPKPRVQARPQYPLPLRRAGIPGEGVISFIVATDGSVVDAEIVRATDVRFGLAALEAVVQWRFNPALLNGVPVPCHLMVPIRFTITESEMWP